MKKLEPLESDAHFQVRTNYNQVKSHFYLRNHVMKIMTTNHITDKRISPYATGKSWLWRMGRLGAMLGVRFVSPWKCPFCVLSFLAIT